MRPSRLTISLWCGAALLPLLALLPSYARAGAIPATQPVGPELQVGSLHNVHALSSLLLCGSGPESDADFAALAARGIKTIISVDGGKPPVELAEKHGLRYVHLPFGYDGIPRERELEIVRAVRELPGPIYIHCHHGQHRGPAAAAVAAMSVEGWTAAQADAALHVFGTSPHYKGLYESVENFRLPTKKELDAADGSFPRVAKLNDLSEVMVKIDGHWDHLKAAREAHWATPTDQPDLDPAHEALMLKELLREAHRPDGAARGRPDDLLSRLSATEVQADALESSLRAGNFSAATRSASALEASCAACHAVHRDEKHDTNQ